MGRHRRHSYRDVGGDTGVSPFVDIELNAWQNTVIAYGGTVSAGRMATITTFVNAERAAGNWGMTDDYWALWGENPIQSLVSLKQRRLAAAVANPVFTIDRGFVFDGTTQYINTGFVPSTHIVAGNGDNLRLGVYERVDVTSAAVSIGTVTSGSINMFLIARSGTTTQWRVNGSFGTNYTLGVATSLGYTVGSRNGTTIASCSVFKNGAVQTQINNSPVMATGLVTFPIYIGANNNSTSGAASFRAASIGFACVGSALTPAQELTQYNNVQTWATAIGAQV